MEAFVSLIALLGVGYGAFRGFKWIMRKGHVQASKSDPLSPADLKVLEESAERLMVDLRNVTDECVSRIEQACAMAKAKIDYLEPDLASSCVNPDQLTDAWTPIPKGAAIPNYGSPADALGVARECSMTPGEIELMRGLRAIEHRQ